MENLEEWEIISRDDEDTEILLTERVDNSSITTLFNMSHFILPSSEATQIATNYSVMPNQKRNHEVLSEVVKENILHGAGMEPEHTKQQETNIRDDCQHSNGLKETKGANIWRKRTLGGLLAICSFAAAAAIICIVILGKRWPHQRLHFRIYGAREQEERNGAKSSNIMKQCQQQPEEIPRSPT